MTEKLSDINVLPYVSSLVALLALCFDLGYFYAIDINLFTLFSLPEHLLFAAEAIPHAIAITVVLGLIFLDFRKVVERDALRYAGKYPNLGPQQLLRRFRVGTYLKILAAPLGAIGVGYFAGLSWIGSVIGVAFGIGILVTFELAVRRKSLQTFLIGQGLLAAGVALAVGHAFAGTYIDPTVIPDLFHNIKMKDTNTVKARVIRSGAQGIMFINLDTKVVVFRKWENIEEVSFISRFGKTF